MKNWLTKLGRLPEQVKKLDLATLSTAISTISDRMVAISDRVASFRQIQIGQQAEQWTLYEDLKALERRVTALERQRKRPNSEQDSGL